jgi:hydroxypyruvate isomerase
MRNEREIIMNNNVSRRGMLASAAGVAAVAIGGKMVRGEETGGAVVTKGRIKQTVCRWCFSSFSIEQLAAEGKRMGLKAVDLLQPGEFKALGDTGLVCSMTMSHSIPKGLNRKENWDECLGLIRKSIDATSEAGFKNVICFSGNRDKMADDEGMKNCAEALKQVVGYAEQKKVTLHMELLNSKVNHHDYMCDRSDWGVGLCKMVGSERFKLLYDIYHMQVQEGDVIATIQKYKEYFGHYHTAGVPGRNELDENQELQYAAVMRAIVETGYTGFVGQEFIPKRDPMKSLEEAVRICDV